MTTREIDALIAEVVCGYLDVVVTKAGLLVGMNPQGPAGMLAHDIVPFYSTSGDGMLLVLAAMRARGWLYELRNSGAPTGPGVVFWVDGQHVWGSDNQSLPLAVAVAALKATGVEVTL